MSYKEILSRPYQQNKVATTSDKDKIYHTNSALCDGPNKNNLTLFCVVTRFFNKKDDTEICNDKYHPKTQFIVYNKTTKEQGKKVKKQEYPSYIFGKVHISAIAIHPKEKLFYYAGEYGFEKSDGYRYFFGFSSMDAEKSLRMKTNFKIKKVSVLPELHKLCLLCADGTINMVQLAEDDTLGVIHYNDKVEDNDKVEALEKFSNICDIAVNPTTIAGLIKVNKGQKNSQIKLYDILHKNYRIIQLNCNVDKIWLSDKGLYFENNNKEFESEKKEKVERKSQQKIGNKRKNRRFLFTAFGGVALLGTCAICYKMLQNNMKTNVAVEMSASCAAQIVNNQTWWQKAGCLVSSLFSKIRWW